jgi:hypothetical protein
MLATCRAHPIRTAALLGALVGLINALVLEISGVLHHTTSGVLLMLSPFSRFGLLPTEQTLLQTTFLLFIEFAANILVDAALFAIPVALIVALLRLFRRKAPAS